MSYGKSCDNCSRHHCHCEDFKLWKPIPCPYCGGSLSEVREHRGKLYRHCYECHMEFYEEGEQK